VNGSFHGCVDSRFIARWILCLFRIVFVGFLCAACSFDSEVQICSWESWIVASCIFVLDLDPPNSEFGLRLKDLGSNLGF
jgi:hypothetical protein